MKNEKVLRAMRQVLRQVLRADMDQSEARNMQKRTRIYSVALLIQKKVTGNFEFEQLD